jgi:hypothetical protein
MTTGMLRFFGPALPYSEMFSGFAAVCEQPLQGQKALVPSVTIYLGTVFAP